MLLPVQSSAAGKWSAYDFGRTWQNTQPASGGSAVVSVDTVPPDELWLIDRVRVSCTSSTQTQAFVCIDSLSNDVEGTAAGNYDVSDEASPIHAPGGSEILVQWTGASAGAVGRVYMQWTVMRETDGA